MPESDSATSTPACWLIDACCRPVPLTDIRLDPEWSLHPWAVDRLPPALTESLTLAGVLHPPLLLPTAGCQGGHQGRYTVVCGLRRLHFARQNGAGQLNCLSLPAATPPELLLPLVLADQQNCGPLSLAEKARFIELARHIIGDEAVVGGDWLTRLSLPRRPASLALSERVLALDEELLRAMDNGLLSEKISLELLRLASDTDRLALLRLFTDLAMGEGKQRRFLSLISEIAARRQESIAATLAAEEIQAIHHHPVWNLAQKISHLGDLLQEQHRPALTAAEAEFARKVKSLPLPANSSLSHSPSFEKDEVTLTTTFADLAACAAYLRRLQGTPVSPPSSRE